MALVPNGVEPREQVRDRFMIAQDNIPTEAQLGFQAELRARVAAIAVDLNDSVQDSREKSLALTALEEALMWAGKAIFK
tara:strand:+ start:7441 stop:7677 length:237 start_codon:yes stop_codon:yes gene_type:complete